MINGSVIDDLGIANAKMITPGDTSTSMLYVRMKSPMACCRMPAIGSTLEDTVATQAIAEWIMAMDPQFTPCSSTHAFLSDLPIASSSNGDGPLQLDLNRSGSQIRLNGEVYNKGLGVHASSEITYNINGNYDEMQAVVGLDDSKNSCAYGSVQFQVFGDGLLIYESPEIHRGDAAQAMSVLLTGVNQLKLIVNDAGDGITCDHASWGGAKVLKRCEDPRLLPFP